VTCRGITPSEFPSVGLFSEGVRGSLTLQATRHRQMYIEKPDTVATMTSCGSAEAYNWV
jgi:hypothetical protein